MSLKNISVKKTGLNQIVPNHPYNTIANSGTLEPEIAIGVNYINGGTAVPIGNRKYELEGNTHEEGGIDLQNLGANVNAQTGEVVQLTDNTMKVFSNMHILDGQSPADLAKATTDPKELNRIFGWQEQEKREKDIDEKGYDKLGEVIAKTGLSTDLNSKIARMKSFFLLKSEKSPKKVAFFKNIRYYCNRNI